MSDFQIHVDQFDSLARVLEPIRTLNFRQFLNFYDNFYRNARAELRVRFSKTLHEASRVVPPEAPLQLVHGQVPRSKANQQGIPAEKIGKRASVQVSRASSEVPERARDQRIHALMAGDGTEEGASGH